MSMQGHPLAPPYLAPGGWPGATPEDKELARRQVRQQIGVMIGLESCPVKAGLAGVGGSCASFMS